MASDTKHCEHCGETVFGADTCDSHECETRRAIDAAVAAALGDAMREISSVRSLGSGEYARGWQDAMRIVEQTIRSIRRRAEGEKT